MTENIAKHSQPLSDKSLVAIGGGRGTSQVLLSASPFFASLLAVIAVTDTGRSTGVARNIGDIPAPGDLRNAITTMASDPDALLVRLLEYRFTSPQVPDMDGMAFGNLFLTALAQMTGDFAMAAETMAAMVQCKARVLPVSTINTDLCAELEDGTIVERELAVRGLNKPPIRRLFLADATAAAHPPVLEAIAQADMVVIGPGSFFTSVLATLLFDGMVQALQQTRACVVYVCNTTTQSGQTDTFRTIDHVRRVAEMLGQEHLDAVLVNRSDNPDPAVVQRYAADGIHLLYPDDEELEAMEALGVRLFVDDYIEVTEGKRTLWNKQDTLRHAPERLGAALWKISQEEARHAQTGRDTHRGA
jgi:uncharacterized cofD-like protein